MEEHNSECPNCNAKLKNSIFGKNALLSEEQVAIINEYSTSNSKAYCEKCGRKLLFDSLQRVAQEKKEIQEILKKNLIHIPVASIHSPINWNYDVLGIVTGQSTTGTGVFSEFAQSFSDFFGDQSGSINRKISGGENMCLSLLRLKTLNLGGNAIIAVDIDYSEVGGGRGILMVCMTGTAIRLKNTSILGEETANRMEKIGNLNQKIKILGKILSNRESILFNSK